LIISKDIINKRTLPVGLYQRLCIINGNAYRSLQGDNFWVTPGREEIPFVVLNVISTFFATKLAFHFGVDYASHPSVTVSMLSVSATPRLFSSRGRRAE